VTGTAPPTDNYSSQPPDRFAVANFTQARSGGNSQSIDSYQTHHYTEESDEARAAIDSAREAVDGSLLGGGQGHLRSAISSYENANFENAIASADQAENEASRNGLIANVLLVVGALLVVGLVAGGGYRVYRSRQQGPGRLK
jgi:multidrug resistance efflux pump